MELNHRRPCARRKMEQLQYADGWTTNPQHQGYQFPNPTRLGTTQLLQRQCGARLWPDRRMGVDDGSAHRIANADAHSELVWTGIDHNVRWPGESRARTGDRLSAQRPHRPQSLTGHAGEIHAQTPHPALV